LSGGWPTRKLVDLCDVFADGDWIETKDQSSEGIRLIQTGNIGAGVFKDREEKARFISNATFERLRCTEVFEGDCLISRLPDPVGRSCTLPFTGERMITAVDCTIVRFDSKQIIPAFFTYYSQSREYLAAVDRETTGTTRKRISRSNLGEVSVPLPSLSEQQRIVAILDEAFDGIATAKANAEKNLQNARALFESHLESVFAKAWESCELVTLSDVSAGITDGDHMPPPKSVTGVPFITIGDIAKDTRTIDFADTFKVPRAYFDALREIKKPRRGDLLYSVTGSLGIPVLVDGDVEFCFQRHIGLIRPTSTTDSSWLYYLLLSPQVRRQATERATGTAQKTVSLKALRGFTVPDVPLPRQRTAAVEFDALSALSQRLESIYREKLTALEALKKSLLHQAFSGRL
jgi:type I restriction enzyme S subunit